MKSVARVFQVMITVAALQACGGGSGGGGSEPEPTDTQAPVLTLDTEVSETYEGSEVELQSTATDNRDTTLEIFLSCDAGLLDGATLTLPDVDAPTTVTCTATTEDRAGNVSNDSVEILVQPARISLSTRTPDAAQGKGIILDYEGPQVLEDDELSVRVGGINASAVLIGDQLQLLIPFQAVGTSEVELLINEISATNSIDIEAAPLIEDPRGYVENSVDALAEQLEALQSQGYGEEYQAVLDTRAELDELSEAELVEFAIFYKQNIEPLLTWTRFTASTAKLQRLGLKPANFKAMDFDETRCNNAQAHYFAGLGIAAAGIAGTGIGLHAITTGAGSIPGAIGTGVAIGAIVVGASIAADNAEAVAEYCVGAVAASIAEALNKPNYYHTSQGAEWAKTTARQSASSFNDSEGKTLVLNLQYRIKDDNIRSRFLSETGEFKAMLVELNALLAVVPGFEGALNGVIARFPNSDERTEPAVAADFVLTEISNANVSGSISSTDGNRMTLSFSFDDETLIPEDGTDSFSYTLVNQDQNVEAVANAELHTDLAPQLQISEGGESIEAGSVFELPRPNEQGKSTAVVLIENVGLGSITLDNISTSPSGIITVERVIEEDPVVLGGVKSGNDASRLYAIDLVDEETDTEILVTVGESARPEHNLSFIVRIAQRPFPLEMTVSAELTTIQAVHPPKHTYGDSSIFCGSQVSVGDREIYTMEWDIDAEHNAILVNYPSVAETVTGGYDDASYTLNIDEYEPSELASRSCLNEECTEEVRYYSESSWAWTLVYDEVRSTQAGKPVFSGIVDEVQMTTWSIDSYVASCVFTHELIATMQ